MSIAIFQPALHSSGNRVPGVWNLITLKRKNGTGYWCLSWSRHVKACRYGLYTNFSKNSGLKACVNLPLLGDFAIWK